MREALLGLVDESVRRREFERISKNIYSEEGMHTECWARTFAPGETVTLWKAKGVRSHVQTDAGGGNGEQG